MTDEMRAVPDLPDYFAASDGTVWRQAGGRFRPLKTYRHKTGYRVLNVRLRRGVWRLWYVHRLVAAAWHGLPPAGAVTRHLNGDKNDNTPANLRWGTHRDNTSDRIRHGRSRAGARNPQAKLTPEKAYAIRVADELGVGRRELAAYFGVSKVTICEVVLGRRWAAEGKDGLTGGEGARPRPDTAATPEPPQGELALAV